MNIRKVAIVAAMAAATCAAADRASAQCGGYGMGGYGYWDIGRLYSVLADNVPYYAAFPPVYYSHPVPRTYGYSPFAYPPGVMTPEVESAAPLAIENPYFSGTSSTAAEEARPAASDAGKVDRTTSASPRVAPLLVVNPFVRQGTVLADR